MPTNRRTARDGRIVMVPWGVVTVVLNLEFSDPCLQSCWIIWIAKRGSLKAPWTTWATAPRREGAAGHTRAPCKLARVGDRSCRACMITPLASSIVLKPVMWSPGIPSCGARLTGMPLFMSSLGAPLPWGGFVSADGRIGQTIAVGGGGGGIDRGSAAPPSWRASSAALWR